MKRQTNQKPKTKENMTPLPAFPSTSSGAVPRKRTYTKASQPKKEPPVVKEEIPVIPTYTRKPYKKDPCAPSRIF